MVKLGLAKTRLSSSRFVFTDCIPLLWECEGGGGKCMCETYITADQEELVATVHLTEKPLQRQSLAETVLVHRHPRAGHSREKGTSRFGPNGSGGAAVAVVVAVVAYNVQKVEFQQWQHQRQVRQQRVDGHRCVLPFAFCVFVGNKVLRDDGW